MHVLEVQKELIMQPLWKRLQDPSDLQHLLYWINSAFQPHQLLVETQLGSEPRWPLPQGFKLCLHFSPCMLGLLKCALGELGRKFTLTQQRKQLQQMVM